MIPSKYLLLTMFTWCFHLLLLAQQGELVLSKPNTAALAAEDVRWQNPRFAAPIYLDVDITQGKWVKNNGVNGIWQLRVTMPNSLGLALYLDQIKLASGAEITLENATAKRGPFTQKDVSNESRLFTGFLPGDEVVLVYKGIVFDAEQPPFHIWRVDHAYRADVFAPKKNKALLNFGASNNCQINANCSQGDDLEREKSSVARIIVIAEEGAFYCSGSLINNTAQDGRPLLLTAYHCQENVTALYDLWRFDFGYRSSSCSTPTVEPNYTSYNGSLFRAGREESDFLLVELVDPDFDVASHYFNGWDRTDAGFSGRAVGFHHPMGDIQKVTTSTTAGLSIFDDTIDWRTITTPPNHHLRMVIANGSAENGSSGSPILDPNRRIRGQMHGGNISCPGSSIIYYGRIFQSWTGGGTAATRLSDWLDPLGEAPNVLDGQLLQGNGLGRIVRGTARWLDSIPLADVQLVFNWGSRIDTVFTDEQGDYQLTRPDNATTVNIATKFESGTSVSDVNVFDIIALRRHILGLDTLTDLQLLAADVSNNGDASTGDIVKISRLILNIDTVWADRPNWLVYPKLIPIEGTPVNIFGPFDINIPNPDAGIIRLDFNLVKNGDVNESAY